MPPSPEQVAALLSKYKATTERVVRERDVLARALREIGLACDGPLTYNRSYLADNVADIARDALSRVTRPERGDAT